MKQRVLHAAKELRSAAIFFLLCASVAALNVRAISAQQPSDVPMAVTQKPSLTANQIASRLEEKNHEREAALHKFQGTRVYKVQYKGVFGARNAEAVVDYNFVSPSDREFTVVSETGSKILIDHVIKGLMDGEKEAASDENRACTAVNSKNYEFTLDEADTAREPSEYVLNVIPRNDNKFLYRGKIWVDAKDFAVKRIEAEPAKNPSLWVKKTEVHHEYEKIGDFWLPEENQTHNWIRLGGRAILSIEYTDYKITETTPIDPTQSARVVSDASTASLPQTGLR